VKLGSATSRNGFPNVKPIAAALSQRYCDYAHGNKLNPLSELLFIICSLQTNEALYLSTYASLRSRFPSMRLLAEASETEIADTIARGGLARQKARAIRLILSRLIDDFGAPTLAPLRAMSDSDCEEYLTSLPGVGRKTARCVMMYSFKRRVFPVDSNCWRIANRLAWVRPSRPDESCSSRDMDRVQNGIDPSIRHALHVNLVSHGRSICLPVAPKCEDCCIRRFCPRVGLPPTARSARYRQFAGGCRV
jgi:endonuclease III